ADHRGQNSLADRIGAERRADRALFQVNDRRGQRARPQGQPQVFGLLLAKVPFDPAAVVDARPDDRHALDLAVEHDRQVIPDVAPGPVAEFFGPDRLERKSDLVAESLLRLHAARVAEVRAANDGTLLDDVKPALLLAVGALLAKRENFLVRGPRE